MTNPQQMFTRDTEMLLDGHCRYFGCSVLNASTMDHSQAVEWDLSRSLPSEKQLEEEDQIPMTS